MNILSLESQPYSYGKKTLNPVSLIINPQQDIDMKTLPANVASYPDDYEWERTEHCSVPKRGIDVALKQLRMSFKKTLNHPKVNENARIKFRKG